VKNIFQARSSGRFTGWNPEKKMYAKIMITRSK